MTFIVYGNTHRPIDKKSAMEVQESLYRTDGPIIISDDFSAYFLMSDFDGKKIPILLSLSFDYEEVEEGLISESIKNIHADFNGIDGKIQLEKYEDTEYYYNLVYNISSSNEKWKTLKVQKNNEKEVAFLKTKFNDDVKIEKNNGKEITYRVKESLGYYRVSIDFVKNVAEDEIILRVRDRGAVRVVE